MHQYSKHRFKLLEGAAVSGGMHISEAAEELGVTPKHLRTLERQGRIPTARRAWFGRVYSGEDLALLKALGVGTRPRRLRTVDEVAEVVDEIAG